MKEYRMFLMNEIETLLRLIAINENNESNAFRDGEEIDLMVYVYRNFLGERDGIITCYFSPWDYDYTLVITEDDTYCLWQLRTRDLRRFRNALACRYGKMMLRK